MAYFEDIPQVIRDSSNLSLQLNYTGATGRTMPNQIWKKVVQVESATKEEIKEGVQEGSLFQCPLTIGDVELADPIIALDSKNIVTRRYVAKSNMRGSIKESWSQDDWSIQIDGLLLAENSDELEKKISSLRAECDKRNNVKVECEFLVKMFHITRIVIDSYSFPHTKGMNAQLYSIKAYSDEDYQLVEEI